MAHYAFVDSSNIVTQVIAGNHENELPDGIVSWEDYYGNLHGLRCIRTSCNTSGGVHYTTDDEGNRIPSEDQTKALRKNYAGIGFTYDEERDAFISPKPFESWILNEETCKWEPPISHPEDGKIYNWNEEAQTWDLVSEA